MGKKVLLIGQMGYLTCPLPQLVSERGSTRTLLNYQILFALLMERHQFTL